MVCVNDGANVSIFIYHASVLTKFIYIFILTISKGLAFNALYFLQINFQSFFAKVFANTNNTPIFVLPNAMKRAGKNKEKWQL